MRINNKKYKIIKKIKKLYLLKIKTIEKMNAEEKAIT